MIIEYSVRIMRSFRTFSAGHPEIQCNNSGCQCMGAMEALSPAQRELVRRVYFENEKISEIAREEGVSHVAIHDRLKRIYQKIKNNF